MKKVVVIGAGKVGSAMAFLLKKQGYDLIGIAGHNLNSVQKASELLKVKGTLNPVEITVKADIVLITTPDGVIGDVCDRIAAANGFRSGQVVLHMSGAHPAGILNSAKGAGAFTLSLHPLQSFADLEQAIRNLPGTFFSIEGDSEAYPAGKAIVEAVGGEWFLVDSRLKPLYHMGAAIASNFLVANLHWAVRTFQQLGIREEEAINALWPLITGSLNNVKALGPTKALTGPIARGDISTIIKHLEVLEENQSDNVGLYKVLGLYTANIAKDKGTIKDKDYDEMTKLFEGECSE